MPPVDQSLSLPRPTALVHEWFTPRAVGGAETVVQHLDQVLSPRLFALVDGESGRRTSWLHGREITTSFVQRLPWGASHVQHYLPLLPLAVEHLDLRGHPLVVSSSHLVAKGVLTSPDQLHVSYVHTPARYAWDQMQTYLQHSRLARSPMGPWIRWQLHRLRQWDQLTAQRVDVLVANSRFTARRIWRYWRRRSCVIHPPVAVDGLDWQLERRDFYLSLSRLVPYKRVDVVVEAFNRCGLPLLVVGDGPERQRLQRLAGPNVQLLGRLATAEVQQLLGRCRAFVYAGIEDFGMAPVEAMAAGAPVIGLGCGGLLDSVRCLRHDPGQATGVLFHRQCPRLLADVVSGFQQQRLWECFPAERLRRHAERFAPRVFRERMLALLAASWQQFQADPIPADGYPSDTTIRLGSKHASP